MNSLVHFLLIFCVVFITTSTTSIDENQDDVKEKAVEGRSIASSYEVDEANEDYEKREQHEAFRKRAKPLKNIFMGIYKNYKSTYLGNKTSMEYKKTLRDRLSATPSSGSSLLSTAGTNTESEPDVPDELEKATLNEASEIADTYGDSRTESEITEIAPTQNDELDVLQEQLTNAMSFALNVKEPDTTSPSFGSKVSKNDRKRKRKYRNHNKHAKIQKSPDIEAATDEGDADDLLTYIYSVGPGVNMSLDMSNDIINVNLNADNLREIMHGRWLSDNSEQGRSKKYDMVTKVLPLFILPFLIQSAIVPFLVTKLKLLLVKSILVGKLAIFLLILSAIKNSNKMMQTYEVAPSYWAGEPSRRSELASVASSAAYNGYRVEGKPTTWIN